MSATEVIDITAVDITEGDILLRTGKYRDVLERAAALDGFDDVGKWMFHFVTYYASEFTAAAKGDNGLAMLLMQANIHQDDAA